MKEQGKYLDQVVMVSGGLGDIGRAIAWSFGKQGAKVALSDIQKEDDAREKLAFLEHAGITFCYHCVDVRNAGSVGQWLRDIEALWGQISIAVANAATVTIRNFREISPAQWSDELRVNLDGSFYLANAAAAHFVRHGIKGNIVFLGSWAAHAVHASIPAYSVSKAAVRMLCKSMALEYAPDGIRINEIAPGYVHAGVSKEVWKEQPELAEAAREKVPLKKLIEASEVADQLLWMCDPANRHLTGSTILMDGGLSLLTSNERGGDV